MSYPEDISEYIATHLKREHDALEEMCERMLVTPDVPGISVQRTWKRPQPGDYTMSCETEYRFNPDVPPMTIGYLPDVYK